MAPATFTLSAAAADSDGAVSRVAFYANGSLIATDTTVPYSVTWSNVNAGGYSLSAVATDNAGAATTSVAVAVTVTSAAGGGAVSFVGVDTATRGNWKGTYGTQGSALVGRHDEPACGSERGAERRGGVDVGGQHQ